MEDFFRKATDKYLFTGVSAGRNSLKLIEILSSYPDNPTVAMLVEEFMKHLSVPLEEQSADVQEKLKKIQLKMKEHQAPAAPSSPIPKCRGDNELKEDALPMPVSAQRVADVPPSSSKDFAPCVPAIPSAALASLPRFNSSVDSPSIRAAQVPPSAVPAESDGSLAHTALPADSYWSEVESLRRHYPTQVSALEKAGKLRGSVKVKSTLLALSERIQDDKAAAAGSVCYNALFEGNPGTGMHQQTPTGNEWPTTVVASLYYCSATARRKAQFRQGDTYAALEGNRRDAIA